MLEEHIAIAHCAERACDLPQPLAIAPRNLISARAPGARVVLGGPGTWQMSPDEQRAAGIDHIITGYAEANVAEIFRRLMRGGAQPEVLEGQGPAARDIFSRRAGFCRMARTSLAMLGPA